MLDFQNGARKERPISFFFKFELAYPVRGWKKGQPIRTDLKTKHVKTLMRCGNALLLDTSRWNWSNHSALALCDEEFAALIFPELLEIEELKSYLPNGALRMHFRILKSVGELFTLPHHCCARHNGSLSVSLSFSAHGLVIITLLRRIRVFHPGLVHARVLVWVIAKLGEIELSVLGLFIHFIEYPVICNALTLWKPVS